MTPEGKLCTSSIYWKDRDATFYMCGEFGPHQIHVDEVDKTKTWPRRDNESV